jgi:hypothetical protein
MSFHKLGWLFLLFGRCRGVGQVPRETRGGLGSGSEVTRLEVDAELLVQCVVPERSC